MIELEHTAPLLLVALFQNFVRPFSTFSKVLQPDNQRVSPFTAHGIFLCSHTALKFLLLIYTLYFKDI